MAQLKLMKKEWFNWFDKTFLDNITAWTEYYYINPDSQHWISDNLAYFDDIAETTKNGVTCIVKDGGLYLDGTATARTTFNVPLKNTLPAGYYSMNSFNDTDVNNVIIDVNSAGGQFCFVLYGYGQNQRTNISSNHEASLFTIIINSGKTLNNSKLTPVIYKGSRTPSVYNPHLIKIEDILGVVDLGSLTWVYENNQRFSSSDINDIKDVGAFRNTDIFTNFYNSSIVTADKTIFHYQKRVIIYDSNYTSAEAFKDAMQGKYMIYIKDTSPY